jgi:hypothetical protein
MAPNIQDPMYEVGDDAIRLNCVRRRASERREDLTCSLSTPERERRSLYTVPRGQTTGKGTTIELRRKGNGKQWKHRIQVQEI